LCDFCAHHGGGKKAYENEANVSKKLSSNDETRARFTCETKHMTQYRVNFRSMPWTRTGTGVRQKTFRFDRNQLRLVEYSKLMPPHWCEKGHVGYMLAGKMEVRFGNEIQAFSAGDGIYLPSGPQHKHSVTILTDTAILVFVEHL
jgi:hypothetical protein